MKKNIDLIIVFFLMFGEFCFSRILVYKEPHYYLYLIGVK